VKSTAVDKRRLILDGAVRVFARQGFHTCRVSDIADEAGVAYGLVYHYFQSKDEVLDTLFLERWELLLETIADIDARPVPARDKLHAIASFIVDSYRHDPDLMKVIVVEVTRAANTFGSTHIEPGRRLVPLRGQRRLRRHGVLRHDRAGPDRLDLRLAGGGRGRI
jgi:AcrR family transcriptional regulator